MEWSASVSTCDGLRSVSLPSGWSPGTRFLRNCRLCWFLFGRRTSDLRFSLRQMTNFIRPLSGSEHLGTLVAVRDTFNHHDIKVLFIIGHEPGIHRNPQATPTSSPRSKA